MSHSLNDPLDVVLEDLSNEIDDLGAAFNTLRRLQEDGYFKYASKGSRRVLFMNLQSKARAVEEIVREVIPRMKKIKRIRADDSSIDSLIGIPYEVIRAAENTAEPDESSLATVIGETSEP